MKAVLISIVLLAGVWAGGLILLEQLHGLGF